MCRLGMTFGVSAIARDDVVGEGRRVRAGEAHPLQPVDLAAGAQQLAEREPVAELDAVGVDVLAEQGHLDDALRDQRLDLGEHVAGAAVGLLAAQARARCRTCRCCCSPPRSTPSRRRPSRAGSAASTGRPRGTRGSRPRRACCAGPGRAAPAGCRCCGCRRRRRPRAPAATMVARSFWAMQPPTAICMPGLRGLGRAQLAEVAVELVVGVLPHRAGVEDDDVGRLRALARRAGC